MDTINFLPAMAYYPHRLPKLIRFLKMIGLDLTLLKFSQLYFAHNAK